MKQINTIRDWRTELNDIRQSKRHKKYQIGFVPTMGYLHDGHMSLVKKAKEECDVIVLSIFVNPLQFGPNEDYETYPRDVARDCQLAATNGVDYVFTPTVDDMYPQKSLTTVTVSTITNMMCGSSRPGHFDGVATVVCKLFNIVQPDSAYFGLKDAQQVAVITQLVEDLNIPVTIRPCETLRESDGLAMSSRNVYLSAEERAQATVLYESLQWAKCQMVNGEHNVETIKKGIVDIITTKPLAKIDYAEVRSFPRLELIDDLKGTIIIALAVKIGSTRLIDNLIVEI